MSCGGRGVLRLAMREARPWSQLRLRSLGSWGTEPALFCGGCCCWGCGRGGWMSVSVSGGRGGGGGGSGEGRTYVHGVD